MHILKGDTSAANLQLTFFVENLNFNVFRRQIFGLADSVVVCAVVILIAETA